LARKTPLRKPNRGEGIVSIRHVLHMWKPTTDDDGSYRQSVTNYTISWWFVVPKSSWRRRHFVAGNAKQNDGI